VAQELAARKARQQQEEAEMRRYWAEKTKNMWTSVEVGIKVDEERVRVALEEERRRREEEERKRREEELRRRLEEERIKAAEEKRRREEEEQRQQERLREEERRRQEEAVIARRERENAEGDARKALGLTTAEEDWYHARMVLKVNTILKLMPL
jgi:nucleoporin GLE1